MNRHEELRLNFYANPSEPPCYAGCECCREAEVKAILKTVEKDIRYRLARGDKYIGVGIVAYGYAAEPA